MPKVTISIQGYKETAKLEEFPPKSGTFDTHIEFFKHGVPFDAGFILKTKVEQGVESFIVLNLQVSPGFEISYGQHRTKALSWDGFIEGVSVAFEVQL